MIIAACVSGAMAPGTNPGLSGQVAGKEPLKLAYIANAGALVSFGQASPELELVKFWPEVLSFVSD